MAGEITGIISYYTDTLHLASTRGDIHRQLEALANLCQAYEAIGHIHHAVACSIHALNLYQRQADRANEARVLLQLGRGYDELGNVAEAIDCCEHGLALARDLGERHI